MNKSIIRSFFRILRTAIILCFLCFIFLLYTLGFNMNLFPYEFSENEGSVILNNFFIENISGNDLKYLWRSKEYGYHRLVIDTEKTWDDFIDNCIMDSDINKALLKADISKFFVNNDYAMFTTHYYGASDDNNMQIILQKKTNHLIVFIVSSKTVDENFEKIIKATHKGLINKTVAIIKLLKLPEEYDINKYSGKEYIQVN